MIVFHPRVSISYEVAHSEEWAERYLIPTNGQPKTHVHDMREGGRLLALAVPQRFDQIASIARQKVLPHL